MLVLGIETSTPHSSVAIGSEQGIIASALVARGTSHGEFLLSAVEFLLHQSDLRYRNISAVAVGVGPGLYTGLRIGITTAKTVAQALAVPIVGVSSLDVLAFDVRHSSRSIWAVMDAKRNEIFFARYRQVPGGISRDGDPHLGTVETLIGELSAAREDSLLVGSGALLNRARLEEAEKVEFSSLAESFPRSSSLVELALPRLFREDFDKIFEVAPLYMRRSDAEIDWDKRNKT